MKKIRTVELTTEYENELAEVPFSEYPRPQMVRDSYITLNGKWNFRIENSREIKFSGEILVPFCPESRLSGVKCEIDKDDVMIYKRTFVCEKNDKHLLLHIGACDQFASVFVNGELVGANAGGYLPFEFDISDFVREGENTLRIEARDPMDTELPYGKQTSHRGGMWYTKISGIWQSVWMEYVPENYIKRIKITPDTSGIDIEVFGGEEEKTFAFDGREYTFTGGHFRFDVEEPHLWTPDDPHLYEFELVSGDDRIRSYFGLRTFEAKEGSLLLNGKPIFCHGLLDQGYFPDGIFMPATYRGFEDDVVSMKECGFNMLRKHIKLEPDIFYYYCDKHGMLVFQDMINSGKYSFFVDTALPTVFLKSGVSHRASARRREEYEKCSYGIMDTLYSHPSVVCYTIFNEGWGQFDADKYYDAFKSYDPTRVYDTASGWFRPKKSDFDSEHVYFKPIKLKKGKRALFLSEFGGYSCKIEGHSFNLDKTYGYRFFEKRVDFEEALVKLYETEVRSAIDAGLSAAVLTQVSDVEDETNGLLTYDRRVLKVDKSKMRELSCKLYANFAKNIDKQK